MASQEALALVQGEIEVPMIVGMTQVTRVKCEASD